MPRARRITPEFWLDSKIAQLKVRTRLLYIALWNFADCNGIIQFDEKKIKIVSFPYEKVRIGSNLEELIQSKRVIPYEAEGKRWLWIVNFKKYQYLKKPFYVNPLPPKEVRAQYPTGGLLVPPQGLKKQKPIKETEDIKETHKDPSIFSPFKEAKDIIKEKLTFK